MNIIDQLLDKMQSSTCVSTSKSSYVAYIKDQIVDTHKEMCLKGENSNIWEIMYNVYLNMIYYLLCLLHFQSINGDER